MSSFTVWLSDFDEDDIIKHVIDHGLLEKAISRQTNATLTDKQVLEAFEALKKVYTAL